MEKLFAFCFLTGYLIDVQAQNKGSVFIRHIADEELINGKASENLQILTKQVDPKAYRLLALQKI